MSALRYAEEGEVHLDFHGATKVFHVIGVTVTSRISTLIQSVFLVAVPVLKLRVIPTGATIAGIRPEASSNASPIVGALRTKGAGALGEPFFPLISVSPCCFK